MKDRKVQDEQNERFYNLLKYPNPIKLHNRLGSLRNKLVTQASSSLLESETIPSHKQTFLTNKAVLDRETPEKFSNNMPNLSYVNSVFKDSLPLDNNNSFDIVDSNAGSKRSIQSSNKSFKIKKIISQSNKPSPIIERNKIRRKSTFSLVDGTESLIYKYFKQDNFKESPVIYPKNSPLKVVASLSFINRKMINEDKVMIVSDYVVGNDTLNYCGIFDGHQGGRLAEICKNDMHNYIFNEFLKDKNLLESVKKGISKIEEQNSAENLKKMGKEPFDPSGSCALVCLIKNREGVIACVGDSRAIVSLRDGCERLQLTIDHKSDNHAEKERIINGGGYVLSSDKEPNCFRVYPGSLTVTRALGDFGAKHKKFGGNPKVIIPHPDCFTFTIDETWDFAVLASNSINR